MPQHTLGRIVRRLGKGVRSDDGDAALLDRFFNEHNEHAFAALMDRHGSMVMGVGRRILRDESAAEDVFQAAFLLLARFPQIESV